MKLYEQSLAMDWTIGIWEDKGDNISNLGLASAVLGKAWKAIVLHKLALATYREASIKAKAAPEILDQAGSPCSNNVREQLIEWCKQTD